MQHVGYQRGKNKIQESETVANFEKYGIQSIPAVVLAPSLCRLTLLKKL